MSGRMVTNHLQLPSLCKECGERNYYWLDGTYGCKNGHVIAHRNIEKEYSSWWWGPPHQPSGASRQ